MRQSNNKLKFGILLLFVCCGYWLLDSLWSFLSFEKNLSALIFQEPMSYWDTLLLKVSPYQIVSRIMVTGIFILAGIVTAHFFQKSKRAEKAAHLQRDFLNTLLETVPNPVFYKDCSGRLLGCNSAYEKFMGRPRSHLIGQTVSDLAPESRAGVHHEIDLELLNTPGVRHYESQAMRSDGQTREVLFDKATIVSNGGRIEGLIGIITDITDLKRTEAEKVLLERQLLQAHKLESLGTLAGGIAHDFNNILYGIMGFAELCRDDAEPDSVLYENLQEILIGCKRAKALIRQILAFSKQTKEKYQNIPVADIVSEASRLLKATIPTTIAVEVDLKAEISIVNCDPTQIHQVIMNLCTNAVQAMQVKGGVLTIMLCNVSFGSQPDNDRPAQCPPGTYLKISVGDTGAGIPSQFRDRVFDPFFTSKEQGKGTGMGLAVAHGIVRAHKGCISVRYPQGYGAVFDVYLPVVESQ